MTTTPELTDIEIALKDLVLHELNARAGSPETYEADDIPVLAASIATLGLLNPLIVQKTGKVWGVIAGGRRRAALMHLVNDKDAKDWTMRTKVRCRALPDDTAAATAITVAENVTQKAMDPLDEFEAFARMMETGGHTPDSIATMFGVERRRVIDRLRFSRIHPDIRAAARAREITLDAMKAFADHPDQEVQKAVLDALKAENAYVSSHVIRSKLKDRGVKIGDPIGRIVLEGYRAAGGDIASDLIEEDSILTDQELVNRLLVEALEERAETERSRLGFAWAEARRSVDYEELRTYGRVYPGEIDLDDAAKARTTEVADRLAEIEEQRETDESADMDALDEEWDRLNAEYEELTTGYADDDLARSGVIAAWERGEVTLLTGLVRPGDKPAAKPATSAPATAGSTTDENGNPSAGPLALSESLRIDLKTEQAAVIGSALAGDPALAQDLVLFKIVADMLGNFSRVSYALGVSASRADRPHGKPEGVDIRPAEALAALHADLDLSWWDERSPGKTEAYRAQRKGWIEKIEGRWQEIPALPNVAFLPNSFVRTKTGNSPLARLLNAGEPDALTLAIGLYGKQNLMESRGVPVELVRAYYRGSARPLGSHPFRSIGFLPGRVWNGQNPFLKSGRPDSLGLENELFWPALRVLEHCHVVEWAVYTANGKPKGEYETGRPVRPVGVVRNGLIQPRAPESKPGLLALMIASAQPDGSCNVAEIISGWVKGGPLAAIEHSSVPHVEGVGILRMTHWAETENARAWQSQIHEESRAAFFFYERVAQSIGMQVLDLQERLSAELTQA